MTIKLKIRLCFLHSLIFFSVILSSCTKTQEYISVRWNDQRPASIFIPESLLGDGYEPLQEHISVRLSSGDVSMLGSFSREAEGVVFAPLIPFTHGLTYEILLDDHHLGEVTIPMPDAADTSSLLAIYPSQDTVPMNLLKMYLRFSRPMREGVALQYVIVVKNNSDTVDGVFLDLKPELWNEDRTILTLWLDPGRIKRDLQPNRRLGAPLDEGDHYSILISKQWPDDRGAALANSVNKNFIAVSRDSLSPDPDKWKIKSPGKNSNEPLIILLGSSLDYSLLLSTLSITNEQGESLVGEWKTGDEERTVIFTPSQSWTEGRYSLKIEARLEDLAGNNINRPFEVDLHAVGNASNAPADFRSRTFVVQ